MTAASRSLATALSGARFASGLLNRRKSWQQLIDTADAAGPADDLRIAARCPEDPEKPRVKHGNNLAQARGDSDLPNAREQFAKREVDAVPAALRLTVRGDTTNPRSLPNRRAFNALALVEQERKHVTQHVWTRCQQQA